MPNWPNYFKNVLTLSLEKSLKFLQRCKNFPSLCFSLRFSLTLFLHQLDSILFLFIFLKTLIFWAFFLIFQHWYRFILEKQNLFCHFLKRLELRKNVYICTLLPYLVCLFFKFVYTELKRIIQISK